MAKKKYTPTGKSPGHPTDYKPEYCDLLITHFKAGKSYAQFAALCDVSRDTLYAWEQKHEEFSYAKRRGWEHYQSFWEQIGQEGVYDQTFVEADGSKRILKLNSAVYIYSMKCRFREDWHDSQKIDSTVKETVDCSDEVKELVAWLKNVRNIK